MHARLHYGTGINAVEDERVPPVQQDNGTGKSLPVTKIENESTNTILKPKVKIDQDQDGDVRMNAQTFDTEEGKEYFSCDFKGCCFKAKTIKGLKDHKESHKAKGPSKTWACRWCNYTTTASQYLLTLHVNSVHLNFKPYKCDFCDFTGSAKRTITYHVERKHKRKGFKHRCNQCDFTAQGWFEMQFLTIKYKILSMEVMSMSSALLYPLSFFGCLFSVTALLCY